jgi:hypothetical protein
MNFSDFFIKGLRNTLKLRNGANFSFRGQEIRVPKPTIVDQWMAGEFSTASYEIVIERGVNDVEHVNLLVTARVNEVSVMSYGRLNLGRDLVKFTATSDNSRVTLTASPYFEEDGVTVLSDIKLTFKANYSERINPIGIPTVSGDATNIGGEAGVLRNWNNSNLPNGFLELNEAGSVIVSAINSVVVPGQSTLTSDFVFSKMNFINTDGSLTITTNSTSNTLTLNLTSLSNLAVTNTFVISPTSGGSLNNVGIGATNNRPGTFTQLTAAGAVTMTDGNQQITMSPTGTGTVTVNPATVGNINNVHIGVTNARAGTFINLSANGHVNFIQENQTVNISPTGTGTLTMNPAAAGSMHNVTLGLTTPAASQFTTITLESTSTQGVYLIALSQLKYTLLGASA